VVLDEKTYLGCCILGAYFSVVIHGQQVFPIAHDLLITRVRSFGSHTAAVKAIFRLIGITDEAMDEDDILPSTIMELRKKVLSARVSEDTRDEIMKFAKDLRFPMSSWNFNADSIVDMFSALGDERDISDMEFLPFSPLELFQKDRIRIILSCFGRFAPSCLFPSTPSTDLSKNSRPSHIVFVQRELTQAVLDMKRVLSERIVSNTPTTKRSTGYKNMIFRGEDARRIFTAVTTFSLGVDHTPVDESVPVASSSSSAGPAMNMYEL